MAICKTIFQLALVLVQVEAFSFRRAGQRACRGVYYDGFSRVACETDISPAEQRLYFKEHACVGMAPGSSCRLQTLGMTPSLCFDFCRQHKESKFFGIEYGRDCYCTGYFHAKSTGGGDCKLPCEGDNKEMCGGPAKSSLFEMHFCDASADRMAQAKDEAKAATEKATASVDLAQSVFDKANALSSAWELGVCSIKPQGELVCSLPKTWVDKGVEANKAANEGEKKINAVASMEEALGKVEDEVAKVKEGEMTGELAGKQDKAVAAVKDASVAAKVASDSIGNTISTLAGPLGSDKVMEGFEDHFEALGDTKKGWHAVCALEPIKGQSYIALADEKKGPAACARKCFSLVTGTDSCVAFNYQYADGLAACQLLTEEGLTKPALAKAVPIFEVSESKLEAQKITAVDCWAKKAFMGSHPNGPLHAEVVKQVTVDR